MTMYTIGWAVSRRYGDPVRRLLMLTLAMQTGMNTEIPVNLEELSEETDIPIDAIRPALRKLVEDGHLEHLTESATGVISVKFPDEAFDYLDWQRSSPKGPTCPPSLRRRVLAAFRLTCSYCRGEGDDRRGPDGHHWTIDRIVAGGTYTPDNVTLACRRCNGSKRDRPAPAGTRSLADVESSQA